MDTELAAMAADVEGFVAGAGWDQRPALFALVRAGQFAADEPALAGRLGLDGVAAGALTPIEQESLDDGDLGDVLARIGWPDTVEGCALSQEIVILPPAAEGDLPEGVSAITAAAGHPDRREARLVVAVLRDGRSETVLRLRGVDDGPAEELLSGSDLAPNLVAALQATFSE